MLRNTLGLTRIRRNFIRRVSSNCGDNEDRNEFGIQMLPENMRRQIFGTTERPSHLNEAEKKIVEHHLLSHNLLGKESGILDRVNVELPELLGPNIDAHFEAIGQKYTQSYVEAVENLLGAEIPRIPENFAFHKGWVRYEGDSYEAVDFPTGDAIVFDVETIVKEGGLPAIAAALSKDHWYSWCSPALVEGSHVQVDRVTPERLIPLGLPDSEQVVIGHHVGFDRSFVSEEYNRMCSKRRFLDTLSMHVCVSGRASNQTVGNEEASEKNKGKISLSSVSSANNLADVYEFYCGKKLAKSARKIFEKGTSDDVRNEFQHLMEYCVNDVKATREAFAEIWTLFIKRLPHRVTLFGLMEMLTAYLPVNESWNRYVREADAVYDDANTQVKLILNSIANRACQMTEGDIWKKDPWLWDLDWTTNHLKHSSKMIRSNQPGFIGYPKWYRELCEPLPKNITSLNDWEFGAWKISTQIRCVPKLMKLLWNNYPLHYEREHGWGYLVPDKKAPDPKHIDENQESPTEDDKANSCDSVQFPLEEYNKLIESLGLSDSLNCLSEMKKEFKNNPAKQKGLIDIKIPGVKFMKLPHKNGPKFNVGNPLSKEFTEQFDDDVLRSCENDDANMLLSLNKQKTYWMNARDRVNEQMVVWIDENEGVILPRLMPAGTVSRRAVEKTWLTASNAKKDRIGSELKAMIQAPPGTHFVGADVDSQELWIASLFGDAAFAKMHGSTAFGWMTLQGKKSEGTDMHSKTATAAGCSRDHAKVLNYSRIYGAGERFAARLLQRFNPALSKREAWQNAKRMFESTKGRRDVDTNQWIYGTESAMFNELETTVKLKPQTKVLGARITRALLPDVVGDSFMTSRVNWIIQSSAVDYLHLMLVSMRDLAERFDIDMRLVVSIHDEVRFLVRSEDRYRASLALHITNLFVRSLFAKKVDINDLPFSVAFFSAVDVDKVIRKDVTDDSATPSNPHGLKSSYGIPFGEELDIFETVKRTNGGKLSKK